ncbi:MAG: alanine--tRNA ligase, partial [Rhodospirillales bacterium]|nr:alanine--tRNA ligase [Rhodospirillales bacterium]
FEIQQEQGATEFLGYSTETAEAKISALVKDGKRVDSAGDGDSVSIIASQTPFYGESGGQMGDTGLIKTAEGVEITISDTSKKLGALHAHFGIVSGGSVKVDDDITLTVDHERRSSLRANHSVTHLVHEALRRRLGDHVTQKGSQVGPDRMRFDISHPKPVSAKEIALVEADVNAQIRANSEVVTRLMDPQAAVEAGAMALFGEKYGEEVRVVSMGVDGDNTYSTELCGGTHAYRTGDIAMCKIVSESAVAAGVRRIEVVTGQGASAYFKDQEDTLFAAADLLKATPGDVAARVAQLIEDRKKLERDLSDARRALATGGDSGGAVDEVKQISGTGFIGKVLQDIPARELKSLADDLKKKVGSGVVALIAVDGGKASLVVGVTDDLTDALNAVDLVRAGSAVVGGKGGGGRADMAQAGGPEGDKAQDALAAIEAALAG